PTATAHHTKGTSTPVTGSSPRPNTARPESVPATDVRPAWRVFCPTRRTGRRPTRERFLLLDPAEFSARRTGPGGDGVDRPGPVRGGVARPVREGGRLKTCRHVPDGSPERFPAARRARPPFAPPPPFQEREESPAPARSSSCPGRTSWMNRAG